MNIASAKLENKEHDHLIYSRFNELCMSLTEVSMNLKEGDFLLQWLFLYQCHVNGHTRCKYARNHLDN